MQIKIKIAFIMYFFNSFIIDTNTPILLYNTIMVLNYVYLLILWGINHNSRNLKFICLVKIDKYIDR